MDPSSYRRLRVFVRIENSDASKLPQVKRYGDILRINNAVLSISGRTKVFVCKDDCEFNFFSTSTNDPDGRRVFNDMPFIHSLMFPTADTDRLNLLRQKWYSIIYYMYTSIGFTGIKSLESNPSGIFSAVVKVIDITKLANDFWIYTVADSNNAEFRMYLPNKLLHVDVNQIVRLTNVEIRQDSSEYNVLDAVGPLFSVVTYIPQSVRAQRLKKLVTKEV